MDENKEVVSSEKKESYLLGIIGAVIGGAIGTIPWVLVYIFGNMMLSALAAVIAIGEFYGYKLFRGKITKKLPAIITIIAILIITLATFIVIPACLLMQEDYAVTMENIKILYTYNNFTSAIIRDYIISVVFTLLGTSIITVNIKKQLDEGKKEITLKNEENVNNTLEEAKNVFKPIFERYNAVNEENAMLKDEVLAEAEVQNKEVLFKTLKDSKIVISKKGKCYYSLENESKPHIVKKMGKVQITLIAIIIVALVVSIVLANIDNNTNEINSSENSQVVSQNDDVTFKMKRGWTDGYGGYYDGYGWNYYKYISYMPTQSEMEDAINSQEITDYKYIPAQINIDYDAKDSEKIEETMDEFKDEMDKYISEVLVPDDYNVETFTSDKGYEVIGVFIKYNEVTTQNPAVQYVYYVWNDGILGYITSSSYLESDADDLKDATEYVVNSFDWK